MISVISSSVPNQSVRSGYSDNWNVPSNLVQNIASDTRVNHVLGSEFFLGSEFSQDRLNMIYNNSEVLNYVESESSGFTGVSRSSMFQGSVTTQS